MTSSSLISKCKPGLGLIFFSQLCLALGLFAGEKVERQNVCPGIEYIHKFTSEVPWSVHILKIDRFQKGLDLVTTAPHGKLLGLERLTEQVQFIPAELGKPIGGINGDFFSWRKGPYQGDPAGLQILNGELISSPHLFKEGERGVPHGIACFWLDPKGAPHVETVKSHFEIAFPNGQKIPFGLNEERTNHEAILYTHIAGETTRTTNGFEITLERNGFSHWLPLRVGEKYKARVRQAGGTNSALDTNIMVLSIGPKLLPKLPKIKEGDVLKISTATSPDLKKIKNAIGGGPVLVRDGKAQKFQSEPHRDPRSAVGYNNTHCFFVVVDGRREKVSDGMTFDELAKEMVRCGCTQALNLDGGGSAMLWVNGEIKNQPSDNKERPNGNSLVVVRKENESSSRSPKDFSQHGAELLLR